MSQPIVKYLALDEVLEIHSDLIKEWGGLPGIRDKNALESCLDSPKMSFCGHDLYPTIFDKAAAYLYHIVCNHAFNDANKRTGYSVTKIFLTTNNVIINFKNDDFVDLILEVAKGKTSKYTIEIADISEFLRTGRCPAFKTGFKP